MMIKKLKAMINKAKVKESQKARGSQQGNLTSEDGKEIQSGSYFQTAKTWADDIYTATIVSRNRYKIAFLSMTGLCALLTLCVSVLVPVQHTELVVVHEGPSGYVWLSTTKRNYHPSMSWARTQSEIARYVIARESYDPLLYRYQTSTVNLLSSSTVQAKYELAQSSQNKAAPINILGGKGYRTVTVNNVLLLDSKAKNHKGQMTHRNLAQVDFVVTDHLFGESQTIKTPYTALVSWTYNGIPQSPEKMLKDWDGFQITRFDVQPVNMGNTS